MAAIPNAIGCCLLAVITLAALSAHGQLLSVDQCNSALASVGESGVQSALTPCALAVNDACCGGVNGLFNSGGALGGCLCDQGFLSLLVGQVTANPLAQQVGFDSSKVNDVLFQCGTTFVGGSSCFAQPAPPPPPATEAFVPPAAPVVAPPATEALTPPEPPATEAFVPAPPVAPVAEQAAPAPGVLPTFEECNATTTRIGIDSLQTTLTPCALAVNEACCDPLNALSQVDGGGELAGCLCSQEFFDATVAQIESNQLAQQVGFNRTSLINALQTCGTKYVGGFDVSVCPAPPPTDIAAPVTEAPPPAAVVVPAEVATEAAPQTEEAVPPPPPVAAPQTEGTTQPPPPPPPPPPPAVPATGLPTFEQCNAEVEKVGLENLPTTITPCVSGTTPDCCDPLNSLVQAGGVGSLAGCLCLQNFFDITISRIQQSQAAQQAGLDQAVFFTALEGCGTNFVGATDGAACPL